MPPPCLPRHLRPCRRLWSARQVRFASDKPCDSDKPSDSPSTAGGDNAESVRWPKERKPPHAFSSGSSFGHRATPASAPTAKKLGVRSGNGNGKGRRDLPAAQAAAQPTASTRTGAYKSQAQQTGGVVGGGPAASSTPQLRIHKHLAAQENERVSDAIRVALEKKVQLEEKRQSEARTETENELRQKLQRLEEQLALLQEKLEAGSAATAKPTGQPPEVERTAKHQGAAAEARDSGSTPATTKSTVDAAKTKPTVDAAKTKPTVDAAKTKSTVDAARSSSEAAVERSTEAAVQRSTEARRTENNTLAQQIQAQSSSMRSSSHQQPPRPGPQVPSTASDEVSEQSLLDELFPEASSQVHPDPSDKRPSPPKLDLPAPDTNPHIRLTRSDSRSDREKAADALRARGEQTTVLQLSNCSTALTEADFRRLIPRGLHIETWSRDGEFYKIIPGRDPLSLERLPFYYLLFHTPASALAYQKNASRLSKLSALHAPSSIHSAIPPPAGFLEDGEDIHAVTSSFVLHPNGHALDLRTVMQPYNRALRSLIDAGGYAPIVPSVDSKGRRIHRVLMHVDGYEPSHWDLWQIISRHAHARGIIWPFRNDHASAVRRLRDAINLKTVSRAKFQAVSTSNPRAASPLHVHGKHGDEGVEYEDPTIASFLGTSSSSSDSGDAEGAKEMNQLVMNRVYNRWIVEFEDEDAARRFAGLWHRVVLPDAKDKTGAWREAEEVRWVEAEYLW